MSCQMRNEPEESAAEVVVVVDPNVISNVHCSDSKNNSVMELSNVKSEVFAGGAPELLHESPCDAASEENSQSKKPRLSTAVNSEMSLSIRPVMSDEQTRDIELRDVVIATIGDRREAANLTSKLPPLPPSLTHLKRIRSRQGLLQVIIEPPSSPEEKQPEDRVGKSLAREPEKYKGLDLSSLRVVKVPSSLPLTRRQYNAVSTYWPCNFHPDKHLEKLMSDNGGFSPEELKECKINVEVMLESHQTAGGQPVCLIYDPSPLSKEILVCTPGVPKDLHPIKHCVLVALDGVAKLQGGSSWQYGQYELPGSFNIFQTNPSARVRNGPNDYLCTGLDAYVTHEPCLMCCMALLHTRIRRVFFLSPSEEVGALESVTKLHCLPNINHRFQVFNIVLSYAS